LRRILKEIFSSREETGDSPYSLNTTALVKTLFITGMEYLINWLYLLNWLGDIYKCPID